MSRFTSCMLDISSENRATGVLKSTAIFFAMESTKAVFPIAGRAAMITRSEFCQPEVILSRSLNPVSSPLNPDVLVAAFWMSSIDSRMIGLIWVTSFFTLRWDISKSFPSASCMSSSTSWVSSKALF